MFKSDLADIGTINPGETTTVAWDILGDPKHVIHWQPDCGCTASIRVEGNQLLADFTEEDAVKLTHDQKENWYPSGLMPVTKGIWVYLKDKHDLWILDENGKQIINPEKTKMKLTFIGYTRLTNQLTLG